MQMLTAGVCFKTAPVHIREKIAFTEQELSVALKELNASEDIIETVILSTCNRTEFYLITKDLDKARDLLVNFIEQQKNIDFGLIRDYFYTYFNKFAAEHLYRVVSGIESQVIGENEILAQVKNAFYKALNEGTTGKIFNALFKFAIETGKRVRTETSISKRRTSVGSLVGELAADSLPALKGNTALILGAGKISEVTARNLIDKGITDLYISNRTFEKAVSLSQELNVKCIEFEKLPQVLEQADIIVTGTGASEYVLKKANFQPLKPVLLVDLSIPRNIDPALGLQENIRLVDMDSLEKTISVNLEERKELIKEAEAIIQEDMNKFIEWYNNLDVTPVIASLASFFEDIRTREIAKTLKKHKLDDEAQKVIDIVTKAMMQRVLHYPVNNLKMEEDKQLQKELSDNLKYLFQLDAEDEYQKYFRKNVSRPAIITEPATEILGIEVIYEEPVKTEANASPKVTKCPFAHI